MTTMNEKAKNKSTLLYIILYVLLLAMPLPARCEDRQLGTLLRKIDYAVEHYDVYVRRKTDRIDSLQRQLRQAGEARRQYDLAYRLYQEYLPFVNDSAIYYLNRCADIARRMNDTSREGLCLSLAALSCSNAGLYIEAESILADLRPETMHGSDLGIYYYANAHLAGEIAYYGKSAPMRRQYEQRADRYRALMMQHLPSTYKYHQQCREMIAYDKKDYRRSLALNTQWLGGVKRGSTDYALVTFYRYLEYKAVGDSAQMMRWLAESVLSDVENAVMDQGSMWEMANLLMSGGDVDRSYRYICFTSDCADRFGSRQRLSRISPLLSRIAKSYKAEVDSKERSLRQTVAVISVMSLLLLAALFYLYRNRNQLSLTRDKLSQSNEQLTLSNAQLSALNAQLSTLNSRLTEANRVKEEYVGRFMRLCSLYIDKLDDLRKKVAKRVKNKQYAELAELTRSTEFKDRETNELYANFDTAFLNLFPTFVDEFNALLKPECQIVLADKTSLTTVVRIFALIRLGISDSSKIAEFLHYSVNTIYNYRANTKNGAVCDRAEFENRVRLIGLPSNGDS